MITWSTGHLFAWDHHRSFWFAHNFRNSLRTINTLQMCKQYQFPRHRFPKSFHKSKRTVTSPRFLWRNIATISCGNSCVQRPGDAYVRQVTWLALIRKLNCHVLHSNYNLLQSCPSFCNKNTRTHLNEILIKLRKLYLKNAWVRGIHPVWYAMLVTSYLVSGIHFHYKGKMSINMFASKKGISVDWYLHVILPLHCAW